MKIGFYLGTLAIKNGLKNFDFKLGNPGIGGTEYIFLLLASLLAKRKDFEVFIYNKNNGVQNVLPLTATVPVENLEDAVWKAKKDGIQCFIFAPSTEKKVYELIDDLGVKSITWMQNRFTSDIADYIAECSNVVVNVCASREQYDCIIDHLLWYKSIVIKNAVFSPDCKNKRNYVEPVVTYMGHLSYNRGFHILAKQWKKILRKVPNAKLYVIGAANLYNDDVKLGSLGVAEASYEEKFKKYITDTAGNVLKSVHFCGKMGLEKYDIFSKTIVGVVNPFTREMGPYSALEMEICSIPIVSIKRFGQVESIAHMYSGLLVNNKRNVWKSIVRLLTDRNLYEVMSINAKNHVIDNYCPEKILYQWVELLHKCNEEGSICIQPMMPDDNYFNDFKWIRIINRRLKTLRLLTSIPSLLYYEKLTKTSVAKVRNILRNRGCK